MLGGISPSRAIARKIRAWLKKVLKSTLVKPARAPAAINPPEARRTQLSVFSASSVNAEATAAFVSMSG